MAIYHLSIKIISRGKGKSAVAAAAYRAGETITNEYDGITHDYTRKGGIVHTEILLPDHAPAEYADHAVLWNAVEKVERYKTAQLAREIEIAIPVELNELQSRAIVRTYVQKNFVDKGMCADICIHRNKDGENPHAHIMLTMRPLNEDGTWGQKSYTVDGQKVPTTDWNERDKAEEWRSAWADTVNAFFEKQKKEIRIDHRSYKRQGVEQIPTIHLGVAAAQMERRGIRTERGNRNREIEVTNKRLQMIKARITKLKKWVETETVNTEPPTLADVIQSILHKDGNKAIYNLKNAVAVFNFLQGNKIMDLQDLEKKLSDMIGNQFVISGKLKPINRRLDTLKEHLRHSDNFKQYRGHKAQYEKLYAQYKVLKKSSGIGVKRKTQKALDTANEYRETYRREITLYEAAEQYLKDTLQSHYDPKKLPPIKKWKADQADLLSQKSTLNIEYKKLKAETREVEKIRREVDNFFRANRPKEKSREQGMEI